MTTIAGLATTNQDLSILVDVLGLLDANIEGSALIPTVSDANADLTVFAPTNAAFSQLAADLGFTGDTTDTSAVTGFLAANMQIATLNAVVLYHVSAGSQTAATIAAQGSVNTLQGATIGAGDLPTLVDNEPDIIDPSLIATDISADNGVVHLIDRVLLPVDLSGNNIPTITGTVLQSGTGFDDNSGDFDILREAVIAADLAGTLDTEGADFTVFAPTDAGFVALSQALGFEGSDEAGAFGYIVDALRLLSGGADPIPLLTTVLTYHVAGESLQASQVIAQGSVDTLQGGTLTLDGLSLVDADPDIGNPSLIATDIQASNGIIHALDGVLIPADLLQSNGANDVDFVIGDNGREFIRTKADNDFVDVKGGRDIVFAGSGDDVVLGGDGHDAIYGGRDNDLVKGEAGPDILSGNRGNDTIEGGADADNLFGGGGNDILDGGADSDRVYGGNGDDVVNGGDGNDRVSGGSGNDIVDAGAGRDFVYGGRGDDTISGGTGNDFIWGGQGRDTFVFNEGDGKDLVLGFRANYDKVDLSDFELTQAELADAVTGGFVNTYIHLGDDTIQLFGTSVHSLGFDDFIL